MHTWNPRRLVPSALLRTPGWLLPSALLGVYFVLSLLLLPVLPENLEYLTCLESDLPHARGPVHLLYQPSLMLLRSLLRAAGGGGLLVPAAVKRSFPQSPNK